MSWIFEKSATWRRVVATTRESRLAMVAFSAVCFAAPVGLGLLVMNATNPSDQEERHKVLRARAGLDGKMLAKANRERLGVLLSEVENGTDNEERYRFALDGRTKGTSAGTTQGRYRGHE